MRARAFTLVEILIVVVILSVLAAIVVPAFAGAIDDSRKGAFVADLKTFADAAELYTVREGAYPADGSTGVVPAGFETYVEAADFTAPTPIGGRWDTEFMDNGFTSAVGVHFQTDDPGQAFMETVDALFDDGDVLTGVFQQAVDPTRYYYVIAP